VPRHRDKSGFSAFDAPTRSDLALPVRHGDRVLRESCAHLPLFRGESAPLRSRSGEARAARPEGRAPRLSMGHNDSTSHAETLTPEPKPLKIPEIAVWGKGSRADFPGIQHLSRKPRNSPPPRRSPRGKVLSFSESSRRNFQRYLSTVDRHAPAFTMCLSCPGVWDASQNPAAKVVFLLLLKQITSSRDERIRSIGLVWKQEIQSREAVHFHLLLWGVTAETRAFVHDWISTRWNAFVCRRCDEKGRADHLAVHLHEKNFQEVRNMAGYFAKYIGKDAEAVLVGDPIPGRWWGSINSDRIPFAEKSVLSNPPVRYLVTCHRLARKLRQKRANAAKHAAICRKLDMLHLSGPHKGKPLYSEFNLACGSRRESLREHIRYFAKTSPGPYKFPGPLNTGAIVLVGEFAPSVAKQILQFAASDLREYISMNPF